MPDLLPAADDHPDEFHVAHVQRDDRGESAAGQTGARPSSRIARLVAFGAVRKEADAPAAGEVSALFMLDRGNRPHLVPALVDGKSWLVFPAKYSEYTFFVGDEPVRFRVPADFHEVEPLFLATYFRDGNGLAAQWERARAEGTLQEISAEGSQGQQYRLYRLPLGRTVRAGDPLIRFDLLRGDMLLVDRFSYHFVRPRVGSAFVFETEAIPDFPAGMEGSDEFLIKRIVGLPGDILEIREPTLFRNGRPIEGAEAFDLNARKAERYRGYFNAPENGGRYLFAENPPWFRPTPSWAWATTPPSARTAGTGVSFPRRMFRAGPSSSITRSPGIGGLQNRPDRSRVTCVNTPVLRLALGLLSISAGFGAESAPMPIWPGEAPGDHGEIGPEADMSTPKDNLIAGKPVIRLGNVSVPTITVCRPPAGKSTGRLLSFFPAEALAFWRSTSREPRCAGGSIPSA